MDDIFFKYRNTIEPRKGRLLISEPFLPDPNFTRTVVVLCEHNEDGSFGFVLNKNANVGLKELMDIQISEDPPIYVGGPVQRDTLHFLHTSEAFGEGVEVTQGLYWGGDFEKLMEMLQIGQVDLEDFRFFVGYSGWGKGQLQDEIDENSWIVADEMAGRKLFTTNSELLWKEVLQSMGGKYDMFSKYPEDPRLN